MRGADAKKKCPGIQLVTVPVAHEKADLTQYREAGTRVFELLSEQGATCERTSIDEAYVDITALAAAALPTLADSLAAAPTDVLTGTHAVGMERLAAVDWMQTVAGCAGLRDGASRSQSTPAAEGEVEQDGDRLLVAGALVAAQLRHTIKEKLGYTLSAGISHNKMLAKHASGMHKPFQQTVVRTSAVQGLLATLKLDELNGFGGKKGKDMMENHGIYFVADLQKFSLQQFQSLFGETHVFAKQTYDGCRGICHKEVKQKVFVEM